MPVSGEALRKSVHIGFGFAALLLRILSPWQAIVGAVVAWP